jgi:hypothetical protein
MLFFNVLKELSSRINATQSGMCRVLGCGILVTCSARFGQNDV